MKDPRGCPWCARVPKVTCIRESWCFRIKFNCNRCQYSRMFDSNEESENKAIEESTKLWNTREMCVECEEDIRETIADVCNDKEYHEVRRRIGDEVL